MNLPATFKANLEAHFGSPIAMRVMDGMAQPPSVSLRLNAAKTISVHFEGSETVPWCKNGFLLRERSHFALDPHFHAGAYYVQDSSSMVLCEVLRQLPLGNVPILALDACASPGGKSTILSDHLNGRGFLVANEVDTKRNHILSENLLKWGSAHHAITQLSSERMASVGAVFDLILVDAPCSGEGMFRKDAFAVEQWSAALVRQCASTQGAILGHLIETLKEGGHLIYATCTMNLSENENQVTWLCTQGFETAQPDLSAFSAHIIPVEKNGNHLGHYLLPGISTGEGLFISVLRKAETSVNAKQKRPLSLKSFDPKIIESFTNTPFTHRWEKGTETFGVNDAFSLLDRFPSDFPFRSIGLPAYEIKGRDTIPLHGLAMHPGARPDLNLSRNEALDYLRKNAIAPAHMPDKKWLLMGFENIGIGWAKNIPQRLNNYYPAHFALRLK